MKNVPIKFCDFEFSVNPQSMEIISDSKYSKTQLANQNYCIDNFLTQPSVISGIGSFVGDNANDEFISLFEIFKQGKVGTLQFSGMRPINCIMTKLNKKLESFENVVSYEFEFLEVPRNKDNLDGQGKVYTIQDGETLWNVAVKFDISIEKIMKLNPEISSPFNVKLGDKVNIK